MSVGISITEELRVYVTRMQACPCGICKATRKAKKELSDTEMPILNEEA